MTNVFDHFDFGGTPGYQPKAPDISGYQPQPPPTMRDEEIPCFEGVTQFMDPDPNLPAAVQEIFSRTVRTMKPGYYVEADREILTNYSFAQMLLNQMQQELPDRSDLLMYNTAGTPMIHPVITAYQKQLNVVTSLSVKLRLAPNAREHPNKKGARTQSNAGKEFLSGEGAAAADPNDWRSRVNLT